MKPKGVAIKKNVCLVAQSNARDFPRLLRPGKELPERESQQSIETKGTFTVDQRQRQKDKPPQAKWFVSAPNFRKIISWMEKTKGKYIQP